MGIRGYTGEELLRLLLSHPKVKVSCLQARVEKPMPLSKILPRFSKEADLVCADYAPEVMARGCDLVFLALPHTVTMGAAPKILKRGTKVIDLSAPGIGRTGDDPVRCDLADLVGRETGPGLDGNAAPRLVRLPHQEGQGQHERENESGFT